MKASEIYDAALARAMEFSKEVPNTFSVSLARMNAHQEQLFGHIADINREYTGRSGVLALIAGVADTALLNPSPMRIVRTVIEDPGSSGYEVDGKISVVPIDDIEADLPPRMFLRDGRLTAYRNEMAGVASVLVYYAKRPAVIQFATDIPELPAQYHELLVIDQTKYLIRKTIGLLQAARADILEILQEEYDEMLADFDTHLRNYSYVEKSRFGRTATPV